MPFLNIATGLPPGRQKEQNDTGGQMLKMDPRKGADPQDMEVIEQTPKDSAAVLKESSIAQKIVSLTEYLLDEAMEIVQDPNAGMQDKRYGLSIYSNVVKKVQGDEAIQLRRKQEARSDAGFLMDLLRKARSGQVSPEELVSIGGVTPPMDA